MQKTKLTILFYMDILEFCFAKGIPQVGGGKIVINMTIHFR
jgi:hypothetical protein